MKRKLYRIEMRATDAIIQELVILSALSNGRQYVSLDVIEASAKANYARYFESGKNVTITRVNESVLSIDKGTDNLLMITEVEVMELDTTITSEEAKSILDGIINPINHENLN